MNLNARPSEMIKVAALLMPQTMANAEKVTGAADLTKYESFLAILFTGDMAAETIDFRVEVADDSGFSTNKTTLKAATQLAAHASNNDGKFVFIEFRAIDAYEALATAKFARARGITGGASGGAVAMLIFGIGERYNNNAVNAAVLEVARA